MLSCLLTLTGDARPLIMLSGNIPLASFIAVLYHIFLNLLLLVLFVELIGGVTF